MRAQVLLSGCALSEMHCAPPSSMMRYKLGCLLASMCGKHKSTAVQRVDSPYIVVQSGLEGRGAIQF